MNIFKFSKEANLYSDVHFWLIQIRPQHEKRNKSLGLTNKKTFGLF